MSTKSHPHHADRARTISSPVGALTLLATDDGLAGLYFERRLPESFADLPDVIGDPTLDAAERQLAEYFAGNRVSFEIPFDVRGTEFQIAVWDQLRALAFGETASYGQIAERMGNPAAVRAVGLANGSNPISIIVPCHRVIGANGSLTGFGGGLDRKRFLLTHEGALLDLGAA